MMRQTNVGALRREIHIYFTKFGECVKPAGPTLPRMNADHADLVRRARYSPLSRADIVVSRAQASLWRVRSDTLRGKRLTVFLLLLLAILYALLLIAGVRGGEPFPCPPPSGGQYPYCH